jgi:hypothetical protein
VGEATAKGDRVAANERGDREAVIAVAIENLDFENRSHAAGGLAAPGERGAIE